MLLKPDSSKFNKPIPHLIWKNTLAEAFAILSCASPGEVVCLVGPPRVGKSLLIKRLIEIMGLNREPDDQGKITAVYVVAANSGGNGSFSTKQFSIKVLNEIKHPIYAPTGNVSSLLDHYRRQDRTTEGAYYAALERGFIIRGVKYFFIDEAHHIRYARSASMAPVAVMDLYKSFAQDTNCVIVFSGGYSLLEVTRESDHMIGRKNTIEFPRYRQTEENIKEFGDLAWTYCGYLDQSKLVLDPEEVMDELYAGSLGCIGHLRAWLKRVDAIATVLDCPIDKNLLMAQRLSSDDLHILHEQILRGESLVGLANRHQAGQEKSKQITPISRKSGKPFQRKPSRPMVGNRTGGIDE
jgi:hypothetical protein